MKLYLLIVIFFGLIQITGQLLAQFRCLKTVCLKMPTVAQCVQGCFLWDIIYNDSSHLDFKSCCLSVDLMHP